MDTRTIRKITQDEVYIGKRIHGRLKRDRIGRDKKACPKEDWLIIENAHPPIIDKELFDNRAGSEQKRTGKTGNHISNEQGPRRIS